ncbi:hypothetical protein FRC15_007516 [Serendipita sp. 397]|nr:hypothetical protein FRC15_007516 [Serendipita sp. 397]
MQGADIFEDMDIFGYTCKIDKYLSSVGIQLRLVCHLWDQIVKKQARLNFISGSLEDLSSSTLAHSTRRVEVMNSTETCCRKWPCHRSCRRGTPSFDSPPYPRKDADEIKYQGSGFANAQVIRLLENVNDPSSMMRNSINLEALWIHFYGFKVLLKIPEITNRIQQQLTHLHLHRIYDDGAVCTLHLPSLVYLKLNMILSVDFHRYSSSVFPLDICMPKVSTIYLEASAFTRNYAPSIQKMILSCQNTLVNLFISNRVGPWNIFSLENLSQLPKLAKLGWSTTDFLFFKSLPNDYFKSPLTPSPLSFVLLDIDHERLRFSRSHLASQCVSMLSCCSSWLSKVVIPLEWSELEELWVFACEAFDSATVFNKDDPLPCAWSFLDRIDRIGIPIEDRNGVDLRSEAGQKLANRMRGYTENKSYLEKKCKMAQENRMRLYGFNLGLS